MYRPSTESQIHHIILPFRVTDLHHDTQSRSSIPSGTEIIKASAYSVRSVDVHPRLQVLQNLLQLASTSRSQERRARVALKREAGRAVTELHRN